MLYFTRIHFAINRFPAFTDCCRKSRETRWYCPQCTSLRLNDELCSAFYGRCKRDTARICCCGAVLLRRSCCWAPAVQQSIDIACLSAWPTAANPPHAVDSSDRQMDRRTDTVPLHSPCRTLLRSVPTLQVESQNIEFLIRIVQLVHTNCEKLTFG